MVGTCIFGGVSFVVCGSCGSFKVGGMVFSAKGRWCQKMVPKVVPQPRFWQEMVPKVVPKVWWRKPGVGALGLSRVSDLDENESVNVGSLSQ